MKVAMLQKNFTVGDSAGNAEKILSGYREAEARGADVVVSTELALFGYPPRDLLERRDAVLRQQQTLERLAAKVGGMPLIVGFAEENPEKKGKALFNSAAVLRRGRIETFRRKALLPTYDVFDELRYFEPFLEKQELIDIGGKRVGLLICEDIWNGIEDPSGRKQYHFDPPAAVMRQNPDALFVLNGSPYFWGKGDARFQLVSRIAKEHGVPVFYANQVGGNDELIFDGRSFAVNQDGSCIGCAPAFEEATLFVDLAQPSPAPYVGDADDLAALESALVLGLSDYLSKTGAFPGGAVLGLSGGIDSALVACLAVRALGEKNVSAIAMPSPFSSKESVEDAEALTRALGIDFRVIPIADTFAAFQAMLQKPVGWSDPPTVTEENIQARIRGVILMAIANREKRLVLGTGNKSELAMGYATLYGDMAAGLGVISDLPKTLVYRLARHQNRDGQMIPKRILEKPPSAELRPNQRDSDSLPPYEKLDPLLHAYIEDLQGPDELIARGFDADLVARVLSSVDRTEFKRRQMAPGLKVTAKAFGSGRRMPIAAHMH